MKNLFNKSLIIIFSFLTIFAIVLTTSGFKTEKFNKTISNQIIKDNKKISIKLGKIKFKFDIKSANLFLETKNPKLNYQNIEIPIKNVRVYLDFFSLLKAKPKINNIHISSEEIDINDLKKIIVKIKPSNFNSLIMNKVKKGKLLTNIEIYFSNDLNIKNFIAKGEVKEMQVEISSNKSLKDTSFNFFADNSDVLIKNLKTKTDGILISKGNLQIERKKNIIIKSNFFTSIDIGEKNINDYLIYFKKFKFLKREIELKAKLNHNLNFTLDNTFKIINYVYTGKGKINESTFKLDQPIKNDFSKNEINQVNLIDSNISYRFGSDKKNHAQSNGKYRFNDYSYQAYDLKNIFFGEVLNIDIDLEFINNLNINLINYSKIENKIAKVSINLISNKDILHLKKFNYTENKNLIIIENLRTNKKNIISLKKIKVKTYNKNEISNDFTLNFGKEILIEGKKYDGKYLGKILSQKSKINILKRINKNITINLENIGTPLPRKISNFKLIGSIKNGKFIKISSKGDFGNNQFLDISLKSNKDNTKKYLEIYSDLPQALLADYNFFKGLSGGKLLFSSIIGNKITNSKLIIDNFKVINAPGVVKLLSLADFGGLADLAEGEGLSFEKLEIKISQSNNFLKIEELFAVGPSISVLMDGYKEASGLTSLRGTLVPARNLNNLLSKIPVIGKIIIPKEIGEGLFGVSFKMKGPSGKIKTTINPIKTLTPRFITKALEKSKKSK
jgi:hypothetical protein